MSFLIVTPDVVAAAATRLANIGATISDANAAAVALTTELVPAAEDQISAGIAALFGACARDFHALAEQAEALHDRFVGAVNTGVVSYVAAEGANAAALFQTAKQDLLGVVNAPAEALLGRPLIAAGTGTPTAASAAVVVDAAGPLPLNAYPYGGTKQLTTTVSVSNAVQLLDSRLQPYLAAGTPVEVYGYSNSAVIASLEMANLQAQGVPSSAVGFLLVGNPMNPNGGLLARFPGLQLASLGMNFYGATPSNAYPSTVYTIEYDSVADFPRYPLFILSDLNAVSSDYHFYYHRLSTDQLDGGIQLPTSGPTTTTYYMIPANNLPLLNPLRGIPIIGHPIADLVQPDLRYLVNLGYGDPRYGWSTGPANVPTPAGLLPPLSAFQMMPELLASGTQQGIQDFIGDFTGTGPNPVTLPSLSSPTSLLDPSSGTASGTGASAVSAAPATELSTLAAGPADPGSTVINIANAFSGAASELYARLLPTADILNAALISIPAYDVKLFLDGILQAVNGQPVTGLANAIGMPLAANIALYLWLLNMESAVLTNPVQIAGPSTGVPALGVP